MKSNSVKSSVGLRRLHALAWLDRANDNLEAANALFKDCCWHLTKARQSKRSTCLSTLAFSACDVREEIVAQYRLFEQEHDNEDAQGAEGSEAMASSLGSEPPALIHENEGRDPEQIDSSQLGSLNSLMSGIFALGDEGGDESASAPRRVKLASVAERILSEKENAEKAKSIRVSSVAGSLPAVNGDDPLPPAEGLRNRRAKSTQHPTGQARSKTEWTVEDEVDKRSPSVPSSSSCRQFMDPMDLFGGGLTPRELKIAQETAHKALHLYVLAANDRRQILHLLSRHSALE